MKCRVVRHQLLAVAKPARASPMVADHLARCPECREWQRQLVRLERLVPELPVPASSAQAGCIHAVLHSDEFGRIGAGEIGWQRRERALRKVAITFAMAAGLLFSALIWFAWQHQRDESIANPGASPKSPYTLEFVVRKFEAEPLPADPGKRVERLADVAKRLHDRAKDRARDGSIDEMATLAAQFDVLVREGILAQAQFVSSENRAELLSSVADQLARTASDANRMATLYPNVAKPLGDIALAANNGHERLREMAHRRG